MVLTAEQKCLLWLSTAEIAAGRVMQLMKRYHSAQGIWDSFGKPDGPTFQPAANERLKHLHTRSAIDSLVDELERKNVHLLFQDDAAYPSQLLAIDDPPYLLYYAGRISCLAMPMVALVGTRRASTYGQEMAQMLAHGLCEAGVCVVSGLARGIDAAAHQGTLAAGGHTIGILGSGINRPYPPEHTPMLKKIAGGIGLVLSEYPLDAEPAAFHFPHRNRIISGLSSGVVFVEGRIRSGGMLTVATALQQGREVFAIPGRVGTLGSEGPHTILREGARIVTCAQDILDDLGLTSEATHSVNEALAPLSAVQQRILAALSVEPLDITALAMQTGTDGNGLISELGVLEILGRVRREAGNRFCLPIGK